MTPRTSKQSSGSLHLTRKTDYGLLLLSLLAEKKSDEQISIRKISEANHIPFYFLQKIARSLQASGLIRSERGKYGGHRLARPPQKITLKEVVESLEGPIMITQCTGTKTCSCECSEFCTIKSGMRRVNEDIKQYMLSKTLDTFIA